MSINVDDEAIIGPNNQVKDKFKSEIAQEFKMKDLDALIHLLGVGSQRGQEE